MNHIGEALGFKTQTSFSQAFRAQSGMSPKEYRLSAGLLPDIDPVQDNEPSSEQTR
ncbi:helix-turn-helix domain-containing protein [Roseateles oligotrophus]|uniref:helix-turn-helix domain-containing protein n=1 Tax=Roseateles oligotrophus TaxID=1769250 RepID=UPI0037CA3604